VIALALLVLVAASAAPPRAAVRAASPTACDFQADYTISPGLSTSPSSGTVTTNGDTGTITCSGPVNGKNPTGPGKIGVTGHYGTKSGETCQSGGGGDFVANFSVPTSSGSEHVTVTGTFTYGGIQGGLFNGQFQGDRMSGTFQVRPTQGDCVTAPMTKAHQAARGTLH
jgi:hypothetical protein